ncbi:amidohydrolase family protein [Actinotalea subterranea]|uniref:amidohydrolase family protein n=1 Tax=Actinotalea subterranea TaxID=2607497 RepID=UPI00165D31E6|nr:amidohydrolase family protein [Actinotalea subterranea]
MILDAHCHAWRTWPYDAHEPDPDRARSGRLLRTLDEHGVDAALVVAARIGGPDPRTANSDNNDYVAAAARRHPGRLLAVVDVDSRWSASYHRAGIARRLEDEVGRTGAVGVTHYLADEDDGWLRTSEAGDLLERAADLGVLVSLHVPPVWHADLRALLLEHPGAAPVLIHHQGLVDPASRPHLDGLVALADAPSAHVKVSGFHYLAPEPWDVPYTGVLHVLRELRATFGSARLVWGSDHPVAARHLTYRQSLEVVRRRAGLASQEVEEVLGGALARVLDRLGRLP